MTEPRSHSTRSRANPGGMDVRSVLGDDVRPFRERKPPWLKVPAPGGTRYRELKRRIEGDGLHTVCQEAACPNIGECWERGTATFMILGDTCTRRCGFCNVKTGKPTFHDPLEPLRVANQVKRMGLRHAVITSVDRDDLPDYGAGAFVGVIRSIRRMAPGCKVEVLTPDFRGQEMPLAKVIAERPDVFNHNVETVPRLYPMARRGSDFLRSARVLRMAKEMGGDEVVTKSGLMVGLGEEFDEMVEAFSILRDHGVQVLTVGQYLRPTEKHLPVDRYWHGRLGAIAKKAHAHNIDTVLIKSGDGTGYWSQFSSGVVDGLHARGLNVCAWQFIYGDKPGKEAKVGAAAVAKGADCLVLDVEGQYEGKYPQASYFMSSLRAMVGQDYPIGLASFPYVDYHPALPYSVFLGPGGAQYNIPQLYWKDIGTTVDTGYIHTWVWNRIYGRPIDPLGQLYNRPKAGQIKRFRALAMSHGFDGVSWWDWQEAGKPQWKAIRQPVSPAAAGPYPSYPFLHLGAKGDFVAWAQQLLAGGGYTVPVSGYFQTSTQTAVRAFQLDHGLPQTGNLD